MELFLALAILLTAFAAAIPHPIHPSHRNAAFHGTKLNHSLQVQSHATQSTHLYQRQVESCPDYATLLSSHSWSTAIDLNLMFNTRPALQNNNDSTTLLVIFTKQPTSNTPWFALGIGKTMLSAQITTLFFDTLQSTTISKHYISSGSYGTPVLVDAIHIPVLCSGHTSVHYYALLQIPYIPTPLIYSYAYPSSPQFSGHQKYGSLLFTNALSQVNSQSRLIKFMHGGHASFFALLMNPLSFLVPKSIHIGLNIVGTLILFLSIIAIFVLDIPRIHTPHGYLGLTLVGLLLLQCVLGIVKYRLRFSLDHIASYKYCILLHAVLGKFIVLGMLTQVGLGLNTLWPVSEGLNEYWYAYIAFFIFWVSVCIVSLLIHSTETSIKTMKLDSTKKPSENKAVDIITKTGDIINTVSTVYSPTPLKSTLPPLLRYTWQDIDHATRSGQVLIVGYNKEVYDITSFVPMHPGGQMIHYLVAGTDCTQEFFEPTQYQQVLKEGTSSGPDVPKESNRRPISSIQQRKNSSQSDSQFSTTTVAPQPSANISVVFTLPARGEFILSDEERAYIQKATRMNMHSTAARKQMQSYKIGEIVSDGSYTITDSPYQYHRYAQIQRTHLSPTTLKLKFSLITKETHKKFTRPFRIGECVELSYKIGVSVVTRYYTPINGTLRTFEIIVGIKRKGVLTPFLEVSKCGDRQFRCRGPFGRGIFDGEGQERGYKYPKEDVDVVYFLCAGTGVTPFIQYVNSVYMPMNTSVQARFTYTPREEDELFIEVDDTIMVKHYYDDGWCYGMNLTNGKEGVFPLSALHVSSNQRCVCLYTPQKNDDTLLELIKPAMIAFGGDGMRVEKVNTRDNKEIPLLCAEFMQNMFKEEEYVGRTRKIVVCGPQGYIDYAYNLLVNECGVIREQILVLGTEKYQ